MSQISEYEQAIIKLRAEAADLMRQRQHIDERLGSLKQAMDALKALIEQGRKPKSDESASRGMPSSGGSLGLSDSIRDILRQAGTPLSPTEIRDRLVREWHFKPDQYANFLTTVHNTLRRLVVSQDIGFAEFAGRTIYMPMPRRSPLIRGDDGTFGVD